MPAASDPGADLLFQNLPDGAAEIFQVGQGGGVLFVRADDFDFQPRRGRLLRFERQAPIVERTLVPDDGAKQNRRAGLDFFGLEFQAMLPDGRGFVFEIVPGFDGDDGFVSEPPGLSGRIRRIRRHPGIDR